MSENLIPDAMLAPDVAETEESVVNYSEKSLAELVRMFEELVGNEDRMKLNKEAEAIKGAFYKNLIKEKTEAGIISPDPVIPDENQEDAVAEENTAEGHEEPAADNPFDEIEKSFKAMYNSYRKERAEYNRQQEKEREHNLELKEAVIEDLKALLEKQEDVNATFPAFR